MKMYETSLERNFLATNAKRLNISVDDLKLAEMIIVDSIKIDFSNDQLLSLEALKIISSDHVRKHYHNAFLLMRMKYNNHKKLWFTFIYDAFTSYDFKTINLFSKSSSAPQESINIIASKILGAWLEIDYEIDLENKIKDDTLQKLIEYYSKYVESLSNDEVEYCLTQLVHYY